MITIHDVEQGTEEWEQLRDGLYTGTGAEKLLEHSTKTKFINGVSSSYAVSEITKFKGNFYTKRGHVLEEEAVSIYEAINKEQVRRVGFVTNSKFPGCGFSPDGFPIDRILEVKCFAKDKHLKLISGNISAKILAQIHYGMLICEVKLCDFIAYNPDFAKKQLVIDEVLQDNPDYDPRKAFKVIQIKYNPKIAANFKRILSAKKVSV